MPDDILPYSQRRSGDLQPYSDRKRARYERERLDINIMTAIQQKACQGASFDAIYHEFSRLGVTPDQIRKLLVSKDEEAGAKPRRQQQANTGFSKMKAKFRR